MESQTSKNYDRTVQFISPALWKGENGRNVHPCLCMSSARVSCIRSVSQQMFEKP